MSALDDVALTAAYATVRQIADQGDPNAERRRLDLDAYEWTLIVIALDRLGSAAAQELASTIEIRLGHPSAQIPTDSDPTTIGIERPVQR